MGLLQNISLKNAEPYDRIGDTTEMWVQQLMWSKNKYFNEAYFNQKTGTPDGFAPPYSFTMPIKEGGMSSFNLLNGNGLVATTSYLTTAKAMLAALHKIEGFGEVRKNDTSLSLLVQLLAELGKIVGSGEVTDASILKAVANMSASGVDAITGFGEITTSPLNVIAWCSNVLTPIIGEGDITATLKGWCDISAEITSTGDVLTAQQVASAVWAASATDNNEPTTMGEKLNDAGAASNPWSVELPDVYTGEQAGKVLADIKTKANMIPGLY
jgi:hypothetical protein